MFEEILVFICLLLGVYGLACLITNLALWLLLPLKGKPNRMIIRLESGEDIRSTVLSVRQRLSNCGLLHTTKIFAVDCGLTKEEFARAKGYCDLEEIPLCSPDELIPLLEISSAKTAEKPIL